MKIVSTQYSLNTQSFEFYVAGCKGPHCPGCFNPDTWDFDQGWEVNQDFLEMTKEKILDFDELIEKIMIFGGEPLDQDYKELESFLKWIKEDLNKEVWLFTRNDFKNIPEFVKKYCDYIKCGRYLEDLKCKNKTQYGIELATSNQQIYKKGKDYGV